MIFKRNTATLFLLFLSSILLAQRKQEKLSNLMKTYHNYNMFDGTVLVAENGKVIYKEAFGLSNREWSIPNSTDTKFMIGSISKPITATLILILVQKGAIDLEKSIDFYIPEFINKPAAKVTIKQLLNHTSGIQNYEIIDDFFPRISRKSYNRKDYLKVFCDSTLAFMPGTTYLYSSWGYFTLGYLIEKVTGKTYEQVMKEEIFNKLEMNDSGSYLHTKIINKRASGYDYKLGEFISADFRDQSNAMGTGDIYSTVEDLFKFHLALSNHTLINKELSKEMFTSGIKPAKYGYGWFNQNFRYIPTDSVKANYHIGSTEGFMSFMIRMPETNSVAIILCNSSNSSLVDFFGFPKNILKVMHNKPVILKQPIHKKMETLIATRNATIAVSEFNKMKNDTLHYTVDWLQMNKLVAELLNVNRIDEAKIIAESNVLEFPDKDLVMISMANIYLALNRKKDAISFFKKSLQLNSKNEEAKVKLKELED